MSRLVRERKENDGVMGVVSLAVISIGSGFTSLLLAGAFYGLPMVITYLSNPLLIILNILPALFFAFLLYFFIGRAWIAFLSSSIIIIAAAIGNFYKLALRNDPFIASDLKYLGEAGGILGNYTLTLNWKIVFAVLFIIIGTVIVFLLSGKRQKSPVFRAVGIIVLIALSALLYSEVYINDAVYDITHSSYDIDIWNSNSQFIARGFWYPFICSIPDAFPQKPEGYTKSLGEEALSGYSDADIDEAEKVNFVSIMLEAYCDLSVFNIPGLRSDIYDPLHELYNRCAYGELVTNIFAGGTINTERAFLTGYSVQDNYRKETDSFVRYLGSQGYYCEGFHTGNEWFYNRRNVNSYLGFDNYFFIEDYETDNRSDEFLFSEIIDMYEKRDSSVPYFSFSVSYQNHGSYSSESSAAEGFIEKGIYSDSTYNILNNYLYGIADTTQHISDIAYYFDTQSDPVVLIVFGDHKPWLGDSDSVYNELGITLEMNSEAGFMNYYSTPFIIFANAAAKELLGNDFSGYLGSFSPCFLMEEVFNLCSYGGSGYMQLLRDLKGNIDVISTATGYFRAGGTFTSSLEGTLLEQFDLFTYAEYYMRHRLLK